MFMVLFRNISIFHPTIVIEIFISRERRSISICRIIRERRTDIYIDHITIRIPFKSISDTLRLPVSVADYNTFCCFVFSTTPAGHEFISSANEIKIIGNLY